MTSNDVVRKVRRLLGTKRVGHCGTLDPLATGVLPVAVGFGTRLVEFLMAGEKRYRATMRLGAMTDTLDAEGTVVEERPWQAITATQLHEVFAAFTGAIEQVPPMYSALKKDGVPLYKLARQGVEVERAARSVEIRRLELLEFAPPLATFEVVCSKGTYVRTLAHDVGLALGCGAYLTALRRTRNGVFDETDAVTLSDLEERLASGAAPPLLGLLDALAGYPRYAVTAEAGRRLGCGIPPETAGLADVLTATAGQTVLLLDGGALRAIARYAPERSNELRGDFELLRVFMPDEKGVSAE